MRAVHQIKYNKSDRNGTPIKYIVVHDTGNPSRGANATAHYNYFNGGNRNASADFFVDDTQIICVNDYYKYYTWHCGKPARGWPATCRGGRRTGTRCFP